MRLPWLATLDALIDEINSHLDKPVESLPKPQTRALGIREFANSDNRTPPSQNSSSAELQSIVVKLLEARDLLNLSRLKWHELGIPLQEAHRYTMSLNDLDESEIRYPALTGREGLARFVEPGGLFGPVLGKHIAAAIRNEEGMFGRGHQVTFEEGRKRRFTVKRVATIQHLYAVGYKKAVAMFCNQYLDGPDAQGAIERVEKWVSKDRKLARQRLEEVDLSDEDRRHFSAVLSGLRPDLARGALKGQPFPQAFEQAVSEKRQRE
jgi:hypothetical protein